MAIIDGTGEAVAGTLIHVGGPGVDFAKLTQFRGGITSPFYNNTRRALASPRARRQIARLIRHVLRDMEVDVIAGVASGGIWVATLSSNEMDIPCVYILKEEKKHGVIGERIQGMSPREVNGKKFAVIEDLVTEGGSLISAAEALREVGAEIACCLSIVTYDFPATDEAFAKAGLPELRALTTFKHILRALFSELETWHADPVAWLHNWQAWETPRMKP